MNRKTKLHDGCTGQYQFMAIMSSRKGCTLMEKCSVCGDVREEFTSASELRLWALQEEHRKVRELLGLTP